MKYKLTLIPLAIALVATTASAQQGNRRAEGAQRGPKPQSQARQQQCDCECHATCQAQGQTRRPKNTDDGQVQGRKGAEAKKGRRGEQSESQRRGDRKPGDQSRGRRNVQNRDEIRAERRAERRAKMIELYDQDGDGRLSETERAVLIEEMGERGERRPPRERKPQDRTERRGRKGGSTDS